jgi:hypothetical protein
LSAIAAENGLDVFQNYEWFGFLKTETEPIFGFPQTTTANYLIHSEWILIYLFLNTQVVFVNAGMTPTEAVQVSLNYYAAV